MVFGSFWGRWLRFLGHFGVVVLSFWVILGSCFKVFGSVWNRCFRFVGHLGVVVLRFLGDLGVLF